MTEALSPTRSPRSKTVATWIALIGGSLGLHRFYLHGPRDFWAWLHLPLTLLGLIGAQRMEQFGQDDQLAWLLLPMLGLSLSAAMFSAIVNGLTSDEAWDARHNSGARSEASGWGAVLGAVGALVVGGVVLIGTIAFSGQRYFEWQAEQAQAAAQNKPKATQ